MEPDLPPGRDRIPAADDGSGAAQPDPGVESREHPGGDGEQTDPGKRPG